MSAPKCIVCGKEIKGKYYYGRIRTMDVVFCEEHKDFCQSCDLYYVCDKTGRCDIRKIGNRFIKNNKN